MGQSTSANRIGREHVIVKYLTNALVFAGVFYAVFVAGLWFLQDSLVFPAPGRQDVALPEGARYVEMTTRDGETLRHIRFEDDEGAPKLMFFHGNGAIVESEIARGRKLHENGFDVLLVEYRGYGASSGTPNTAKLLSDSIEVYDWYKQDDGDWMFVYAHSLGTGIAAHLSSQRPVESMVLEAPYSRLSDIAADRYSLVPVRLLFRHEFDAIASLDGSVVPTLIVHGIEDRVVPIKFGRKLFDTLDKTNSQMSELAGAGHNDLIANGSIDLALEHFIKSF